MKVQVIVIGFLGLIAAAAVAVLMGLKDVRANQREVSPYIKVLVAKAPLEPMTKIEPDNFIVREVHRTQTPAGVLTDPVAVNGQVLIVPMVEGQAFTRACFAPEGSGFHLAANLPPGKCAINLALADYAALEGLLYPGCSVDVIVSVNRRKSGGSEIISATLLSGVQVLAVDNRTVTTPDEKAVSKTSGNKKRVTILVDDKEAQMVQLAMQYGSITLTLRNPTDRPTPDAHRLHTTLAELGIPGVPDLYDGSEPVESAPLPVAAMPEPKIEVKPEPPAAEPPPQPEPIKVAAEVPTEASLVLEPIEPPKWLVTLIRGRTSEVKSFPVPEQKPESRTAK